MGVERLAPTPQFLDYVAEKYVILDQNKIDVESKASRKKLENQIKNIKEIEIPTFQRSIVWGKDEVMELIESESPVYGTVILANIQNQVKYILLDGLQRFATGTSLLYQLYPLVLADNPLDNLAANNYTNLKAAHRYNELIILNDRLLKTHPREVITESYFKLSEEIKKILDQKTLQDVNFAHNIERMFLENLVAIDEYIGFTGRPQMMKAFVSLNNTGIDLTETDLLRDELLGQAEIKNWDDDEKDDFENKFSNIFLLGADKTHLKKLGKYLYDTILKNPTFIFPNWESFSKDDFDDFVKYLYQFKEAKNNPSDFPYLSEIFLCGGLPFTFAVLHFWHSHYLNGEKPDFVGGDYDTTVECYTLLRACYRSLIVGNIGRIGPYITNFIQQKNYDFDKIINAINPTSLLGSLSDLPDEEFVVNQLFSITRPDHYKRVYNACMLPEKTNDSTDFHPLSFGSKVSEWALDHLIPKSTLQKEPAIGGADGRKLVNFAPLTNPLNTTVKAHPCSFKIKPGDVYAQVKNKHPYIEWLVDTHYNVDPEISALSQDEWIKCLDHQENLTIDAKIPVGKTRIRCIAKLLLNRI